MKSFSFFSILVFLSLLIFIQDTAIAQTTDEPRTHTVEVRETLFSISRKYNISVQNIRDWNNLETDVVPPGTVLYVSQPPPESEKPETPDASEETEPETTGVSEPEPDTRTQMEISEIEHVVGSGQTLYYISRLYDVTVNNLRNWNELDTDALRPEQRLVVGFDTTYSSVVSVDVSALTETADLDHTSVTDRPRAVPSDERFRFDEETTTAEYYVIRRGDTLSSISRRFGVTLSDLRRWNNITGDIISVGQELIVGLKIAAPSVTGLEVESTAQGRFYEYEVKRNDSIFRILLNHQMDEMDFKALNSGLSPSDVRPGMSVVLLAPPTVNHANPYLVRTSRGTSDENASGLTPATMYSDAEKGRTTTGGDLYNPEHLTAAHQSLPLGSVVHITSPDTGKGVFVLVNDRTTNSSIKLSRKAFTSLGLDGVGEPYVQINTSVN